MADTSLLAVLAVAGVAALALGAAAYVGGMGFMGAPMGGGMMGGHGGMMGGSHGQDGGADGMMGQGGGMGQPGAPMGGGMMGGSAGPMAGETGECPCEEMMGGMMGGGMMGGMMGGMDGGHDEGMMGGMMAGEVFYNGTARVVWADPVMGLVGLQLPDGTSVTAKLTRAYVRAGDGALVYGGWIAGAAQTAGEAYVVLAGWEYRALVVEISLDGSVYVHPMALAFQAGPGPGH